MVVGRIVAACRHNRVRAAVRNTAEPPIFGRVFAGFLMGGLSVAPDRVGGRNRADCCPSFGSCAHLIIAMTKPSAAILLLIRGNPSSI